MKHSFHPKQLRRSLSLSLSPSPSIYLIFLSCWCSCSPSMLFGSVSVTQCWNASDSCLLFAFPSFSYSILFHCRLSFLFLFSCFIEIRMKGRKKEKSSKPQNLQNRKRVQISINCNRSESVRKLFERARETNRLHGTNNSDGRPEQNQTQQTINKMLKL